VGALVFGRLITGASLLLFRRFWETDEDVESPPGFWKDALCRLLRFSTDSVLCVLNTFTLCRLNKA
jgi:hypothetical protein